tara:strand:+ start:366 stop:710 length:345 start_codon:yes stop_codon:yes gene_type:complete
MAFIQYVSKANNYSLLSNYNYLLRKIGLEIKIDFQNSPQVYAECLEIINNQKTKVHVLLSWKDKKNNELNIELWSNEPFNISETACKKIYRKIIELIPPINNSSNNINLENIYA